MACRENRKWEKGRKQERKGKRGSEKRIDGQTLRLVVWREPECRG